MRYLYAPEIDLGDGPRNPRAGPPIQQCRRRNQTLTTGAANGAAHTLAIRRSSPPETRSDGQCRAVALALFAIVAIFTLGGAVGVVSTRNVVHAALFLLLSLLGVAGVYLLLFAEFLALVQVLIYGGAVTIVVLFAVMLTRSSEYPRISDNPQWPLGLITAGVLAIVLGAAFWLAPEVIAEPQAPEFKELGASLFTKWALPFEIASLVLLVALIGAIIIARTQSVTVEPETPAAGEG